MRQTNSVIVVTVLMLGNLTVALQAEPITSLRGESILIRDESTEARISRLLQSRGLETAAADKKVRKLFRPDTRFADAGIGQLSRRLKGTLTTEMLDDVLARRALFEKSIDLTSAASLSALFHEATGKAPDEKSLQALHEVAAINRALNAS